MSSREFQARGYRLLNRVRVQRAEATMEKRRIVAVANRRDDDLSHLCAHDGSGHSSVDPKTWRAPSGTKVVDDSRSGRSSTLVQQFSSLETNALMTLHPPMEAFICIAPIEAHLV
jgi:hypothetical protein